MTTAVRGRAVSPIGRSEPSQPFAVAELSLLHGSHPNVLLTGSGAATDAALAELEPCLREPVVPWKAGAFPNGGTLLLLDPDRLSQPEQAKLVAWLQETRGATQVVTATTRPLWPLVCEGTFDEALHYYLNVVHLEL
jgi:Sigma-54 interaction domain